ncbi:MFS transporter [Siccirubricoccus deserti]|uniref:Tripartite tricarboxylate transporter substrate binding protein n=1 Tax=Siccirubricoccus deserti TaxID=2013562 RepID=A0A9X0R0L3_9PROT|nr:tripartite tricarboxylate transporter substrate binding protein [Siccirubricoccus deserti]MBC4017284.1 tripartite tricarboxylate transporter substrate binding protein [Siccirubricoccus deserti]GGC57830.1 MFS transporter [Siccirubricoccus deserti]
MPRRRRLLAGAAGLASAGLAAPAIAQPRWPDRPVRVVVGFPPGGSLDILSRVLAEQLSARSGQPVVVENRPGAGGNIGADVVAKAAPDGTTIGTIGFTVPLVAPHLYARLPFDPVKDFAYVSEVWEFPNVAAVPAQHVPARTVAEFAAWVKQRPQGISYGSPGVGTSPHLSAALLLDRLGLAGVHVPFRGAAQTIPAMLSGDVQLAVDNLASYISVIQEGRMRALAVTSAERWPTLPEVPTMAEAGIPDLTLASWTCWAFPAGTPQPIITRLAEEIATINGSAAMRERAIGMGARMLASNPAAVQARLDREREKWREMVRLSGARME